MRLELLSAGVREQEVKVIRRDLTREAGMKMVREGVAMQIRKEGVLLGFQLLACRHMTTEPKPEKKMFTCPPALGPVVISRAEVEAFVGLRGPSQTRDLTDEERAARLLKGWQEEDFIERAELKVAEWGRAQMH